MKGGKIVSTNAERGILIGSANSTKKYSAKISGGTITCKSPIYDGICLDNTNMTMTGGSIVITGFYDCGISSHGGKITIKGGTVSVTTKRKKAYGAFAVDSMTNKAACLKAITGPLPDGASFKSKGNVYKVFNYANDVSIQQYGAKSTTPVFEKVRFGGRGYDVKGVCSNAFNTAAGKKVTKIRFNNSLRNIGAKAFAGAKSLSKLEIYCFSLDYKYDGRGQLKSAKWSRDSKVAKKAFANCGRKKGAGVTILIGIACTNDIPIYKKLLVGKSLSPRAKILAP